MKALEKADATACQLQRLTLAICRGEVFANEMQSLHHGSGSKGLRAAKKTEHPVGKLPPRLSH
jgi:hypothetical protein